MSARCCWTNTASRGGQTGALAGLQAGLIAYSLIGAAAAGVAGGAPIWFWFNGARVANGDPEAFHLAGQTLVLTSCYISLGFIGCAAIGLMLGGLGGALAARGGARPVGTTPPETSRNRTHQR